MPLKFEEYWEALDNAGPKLIEDILDQAHNDPDIPLRDFLRLVRKAYPEQ